MLSVCECLKDLAVLALFLTTIVVVNDAWQRQKNFVPVTSGIDTNLHLLTCPQIFNEKPGINEVEITLFGKDQQQLLDIVKESRLGSEVIHTDQRLPTDYDFGNRTITTPEATNEDTAGTEHAQEQASGLDLNIPNHQDNERFCGFLLSLLHQRESGVGVVDTKTDGDTDNNNNNDSEMLQSTYGMTVTVTIVRLDHQPKNGCMRGVRYMQEALSRMSHVVRVRNGESVRDGGATLEEDAVVDKHERDTTAVTNVTPMETAIA